MFSLGLSSFTPTNNFQNTHERVLMKKLFCAQLSTAWSFLNLSGIQKCYFATNFHVTVWGKSWRLNLIFRYIVNYRPTATLTVFLRLFLFSKGGFALGKMNVDFAATFIWACAFLFVYSLAGERFLSKVVKMNLTNLSRKTLPQLLDQSKHNLSTLSTNPFASDQIKFGC